MDHIEFGDLTPVMDNQMEEKMLNMMETRCIYLASRIYMAKRAEVPRIQVVVSC